MSESYRDYMRARQEGWFSRVKEVAVTMGEEMPLYRKGKNGPVVYRRFLFQRHGISIVVDEWSHVIEVHDGNTLVLSNVPGNECFEGGNWTTQVLDFENDMTAIDD